MAQGSPMVWFEGADLEALQIRWDDGAGSVFLEGDTAIFTVADRTYGLYAPAGSSWQVSGQSVALSGYGSGTVALALLPGSETETLASFREAANHPISSTHFGYSRGEDPYALKLQYDYTLRGEGNTKTVVALYPHLARHTQIDTLPSSAYASSRGSMVPVTTRSIEANLDARGSAIGNVAAIAGERRSSHQSRWLFQSLYRSLLVWKSAAQINATLASC